MWDHRGPRIKRMSPALAGGYFTTKRPGNSPSVFGITFISALSLVWHSWHHFTQSAHAQAEWGGHHYPLWNLERSSDALGVTEQREHRIGTQIQVLGVWPAPELHHASPSPWRGHGGLSHCLGTGVHTPSLPRHPLKPASPPDALLVTASHSHPGSLFFPLLPHPVAQLVLNLPVQSDGFQAAPPFLCPCLCSGTHPPNSSPRQYPHHVQSTQTFTPRSRTIHPSNSTISHRCEPSVLGQQALTQCKTLSSNHFKGEFNSVFLGVGIPCIYQWMIQPRVPWWCSNVFWALV